MNAYNTFAKGKLHIPRRKFCRKKAVHKPGKNLSLAAAEEAKQLFPVQFRQLHGNIESSIRAALFLQRPLGSIGINV